jgi:hypothetical protein
MFLNRIKIELDEGRTECSDSGNPELNDRFSMLKDLAKHILLTSMIGLWMNIY